MANIFYGHLDLPGSFKRPGFDPRPRHFPGEVDSLVEVNCLNVLRGFRYRDFLVLNMRMWTSIILVFRPYLG